MHNYDLTKLILRKFFSVNKELIPEERKVVDYYLTKDLDKILGKHIIAVEDCDLMTTVYEGYPAMSIDTTLFGKIDIRIGNIEGSKIICAYSDDEVIFKIIINGESISNSVQYMNDKTNVIEEQTLRLKNYSHVGDTNYDAEEFSLSRSEDGTKVYEGVLSPILARAGAIEYFEYKSNNETDNERQSFIERLINVLTSNSIVSVGTNNDNHKLVDYIDEVFKSLEERLDKERIKKDTKKKSKKRVLEQKEND